MHSLYTTINPKTGKLTREYEFVNSWKWKYDLSDIDKTSLPFYSLRSESSTKEALISKYHLCRDTLLQNAYKIHLLTEERDRLDSTSYNIRKELNHLLEVIKLASDENKNLKFQKNKQLKNYKKFVKEIKSYVSHKQECEINKIKVIGLIHIHQILRAGI